MSVAVLLPMLARIRGASLLAGARGDVRRGPCDHDFRLDRSFRAVNKGLRTSGVPVAVDEFREGCR